ncbi:MAG TPA: hypothetical protein VFA15_05335 [Nitrososphaera sp.]|jgi:hypothetical protein|nr:hypothetical protein [uncultured Nitrososphaera sp.]HZT35318.1 hypothetical protein [Nitrososphaera sp.]
MRANQSPRRCKCDECVDAYSLLQELDLFAPTGKATETKKGAITVAR